MLHVDALHSYALVGKSRKYVQDSPFVYNFHCNNSVICIYCNCNLKLKEEYLRTAFQCVWKNNDKIASLYWEVSRKKDMHFLTVLQLTGPFIKF